MAAVFFTFSRRDFRPRALILNVMAVIHIMENKRRTVRYNSPMFQDSSSVWRDFVVTGKGCHKNIAASIQTLPDDWIIEACPFCGERRRYHKYIMRETSGAPTLG
jgi:hypothetical protein